MTAAIRSVFTGGVALASAAVVAVSPLTPTPDLAVPRLESAAVELTGVIAVPPVGAIPYQILVNGLTDVLALAPIVFGSTNQCTACIGPVANPYLDPPGVPTPFTGWGLVGIAVGLVSSPVALVQTLVDTGNIGEALGAAGLALQVPITNTLNLLGAARGAGGFELPTVLNSTVTAIKTALVATIDVLNQALITGPVEVLKGVVAGAQAFVGTLAATGDFVDAFHAGIAPIHTAVETSAQELVGTIGAARGRIWGAVKLSPGPATSPIPTIPLPPTASVRAAASEAPAAAPVKRAAATTRTPAAAAARSAAKASAGVKAAAATRGGRSAG